MWFGTRDGLNRFDGYGFTSFHFQPFDSTSISGNVIKAITEDNNGDLWIGTHDGGLNKFSRSDQRFTSYRHQPDNPASLPSNDIRALCWDEYKRLWVGTSKGLVHFDPATKQFVNHDLNAFAVLSFSQGSHGKIWVAMEQGFGVIEKGSSQCSLIPLVLGDNPLRYIRCLHEDRSGVLWGASDHFIFRLTPKPVIFRIPQISAIIESTSGEIIVGGKNGLFALPNDATEFQRLEAQTSSEERIGLTNILSLHKNSKGGIWVGNEEGITYLLPRSTSSELIRPSTVNDRFGNDIRTLYRTSRDELLVGTRSGLRVLQWQIDGSTLSKPLSLLLKSFARTPINTIMEDRQHRLWIGTTGEGLLLVNANRQSVKQFRRWKDTTSLSGNSVWSLHEDALGRIWIGTKDASGDINLGSLCLFDSVKQCFQHPLRSHKPEDNRSIAIWSIKESQDGSLWMGTSDGLAHLDLRTWQCTRFRNRVNDPKSLSHNEVWSVCIDGRGTVWAGTWGGGLNALSKEQYARSQGSEGATFRHFMMREGLSSNVVYSITEDAKHRLWISTSHGLSLLDSSVTAQISLDHYDQKRPAKSFATIDDVLENEFNPNAALLFASDELLLGGSKGITRVLTHSTEELSPPQVLITSLRIAGEEPRIDIPDGLIIDLPYSHNSFSGLVSALSFAAPLRNLYAYKLDGLDADWTYAGTRHEFNYTNLPPGDYTLRVIVAGSNGIWNTTGKTVVFRIAAPFWQTARFYVLVALLLATTSLTLYLRRRKRSRALALALENAREDERRDIASDLHDGPLQELYSARFILDTLQEDLNLQESKELQKIEGSLTNARSGIRDICSTLHPPLLNGYLEPELHRFTDHFLARHKAIDVVFEKVVEARTTPTEIGRSIFRIFRIALLNAANHSEGSSIHIRLNVTKTEIVLEIEDNGKGFGFVKGLPNLSGGKHQGLLLAYSYARAINGTIDIQSIRDRGTIVRLWVPLENPPKFRNPRFLKLRPHSHKLNPL
jgi:ligand-binding sensor domain-containing protein/signal transduction histidine kinase